MRHHPGLARHRAGAAYIQNLALIGLLALPVAIVLVSLGPPLLQFFRYAQLSLVAPLP
jgi:hypothetical protein